MVEIVPAFYHWKTKLQLSENERLYLDSLGVKKLYVKFFDVDWDEASNQPLPHASVQIDAARLAELEIVPVVFITNRTWLRLSLEEVDSLAKKIVFKIGELGKEAGFSFREIQFDSDWTGQTRGRFFHFLKTFQSDDSGETPPLLSATIRLHQLKFFEKTGVPPVDRGMLMFYNMGDLEDWDTENSILDTELGREYLTNPDRYPLPLDLALPIFRWGVLFRDGELFKLINNLSEADLRDSLRFTATAPNRFLVKKSTYLQGYYLYEGDRLRLESASMPSLKAAASLLGKKLPLAGRTAVFYHLDSALIRDFPVAALREALKELE